MKCHEVMDYMQRYLDGDLNDLEQAEMRKHMRECTSCAEMFERLNRLSDELVNLPKITPPFSIVDSILPQLDEIDRTTGPIRANRTSKAWKRFRQSVSVRTMGGLAAACIILAFVIVQGPHMLGSDQSADYSAKMESSNASNLDSNDGSMNMKMEASDDVAANEPQAEDEMYVYRAEAAEDQQEPVQKSVQEPAQESEGQFRITDQRSGAGATPEAAPSEEQALEEVPNMKSAEEPKLTLTANFTNDTYVVASPDGTHEAYVEATADGYQVIISNKNQERIYASPLKKADAVNELVWSSDGTTVTYKILVGDKAETYIIDIATRSEMKK